MAAKAVVKTELELLAKQRCRICNGLGHKADDCATNNKLAQFCDIPSTGRAYNWIRRNVRDKYKWVENPTYCLMQPLKSKRRAKIDAKEAKR